MQFDESQLEFINNNSYPHFVLANAGSGKSTSLLGKAYRLAKAADRHGGKVLILCFNKGIQEDMQEKIQAAGLGTMGIEVKTLHALGKSFIDAALPGATPLSCMPASRNNHFYFGYHQRGSKYATYPGLLSKVLDQLEATPARKNNKIVSEINVLGAKVLTDECPKVYELDPKRSPHLPAIAALISKVLLKIKEVPNPQPIAQMLAEKFLVAIDQRRKPVDFWKFFNRNFYRNDFVPFIHASITEFLFKKDLYGRFADDTLDFTKKAVPLFYLYCKDVPPPKTYKEFSNLIDDSIGAIALTDLVMQVNIWRELDFDAMLTLGIYAMLKLKLGNYYSILVDEAQDLNILYWYLSYVAYPRYLIQDKEPRLFFVGDIQQALNRWNAACPERFVHLANQHTRSQLIYTYRCPQNIVNKAQEIKNASSVPKVDLPEDLFISAAPLYNQPGEYSYIDNVDATNIDAFLKEKGYRYDEIAILGRTNNDLLPWQLWLLLEQIPCERLQINRFELDTDKTKTLLAMVALADQSFVAHPSAEKTLLALQTQKKADQFLNFIHTLDDDKQDELIMKFFTTLHLKDEEDLSEDEMKEIILGKGAVSLLRKWYAADAFKIRSKLDSFLARREFTINRCAKGITLSTTHRIKGQEANIILIQSNSWGNICRNVETEQQQAEEMAIAYVAVTRAKKATHVIRGNVHPIL